MTDMVDNRLLLVAPISQVGALLAALEGPASWSLPYGAHSNSFQPNFGPQIEITAQATDRARRGKNGTEGAPDRRLSRPSCHRRPVQLLA